MKKRLVVCLKENGKEYSFQTQDEPPKCDDHEVLIKIDSCALSSIDYTLLEKVCEPEEEKCYPVGKEISGIVQAVGSSVKRFQENDEVTGIIPLDSSFSGCSSHCILSEYDIVKKPVGVSFVDAAAAIGEALKAYTCLYYQAKLTSAETVVVCGASKGFGIMAMNIAQYIGAKIIAVGSTDEEVVFLKSMEPPPNHVVDLRNTRRDIVTVCHEETGGLGVDCFIDDGVSLYPDEFQENFTADKTRLLPTKHDILTSLAVGGRWITSQANLQIDPPDSTILMLKCASIHYLFEHSWSLSRGAVGRYLHILNDVMSKMADGVLRPMVHHTVLLDDCIYSMQEIDSATVGKVVVKVT